MKASIIAGDLVHEEGHESCGHMGHSHPIFQTAPDDDSSDEDDDDEDDDDDNDDDDDDDLGLVQGRVLRDDEVSLIVRWDDTIIVLMNRIKISRAITKTGMWKAKID